MLKKISKILMIFIGLIIAIVSLTTISKARWLYFGTQRYTVSVTHDDPDANIVLGQDNVFCIQHGHRMDDGTSMTVRDHVEIIGNRSKWYSGNSGDENDVWQTQYKKENLAFAYILNQADDGSDMLAKPAKYGIKQQAIYYYFDIWKAANGYEIDTVGMTYDEIEQGAKDMVNAAIDYSNKYKTQMPDITNNTDTSAIKKQMYTHNGTQYIKVGPFNFSYTTEYTDKHVKDQDGNEISGVKYARYSGSTLQVYDNINDGSKSGQNFYLLIPADSGATKISEFIALSGVAQTRIKSDIWILQGEGDHYDFQRVISTTAEPSNETGSDSVSIKNISLTGSLTITKVDKSTDDPLANVAFTVKMTSGAKSGYYVTGNGTYSKTLTEHKTNSNGKITLSSLLPGTYEITETQNPNAGYNKNPNIKKSKTVNVGSNSIEFENEQELGTLVITKKDSNSDEKLENVRFYIKMTTGDKQGKYLYRNSSGNAAYSDNKQPVTTDANGQIRINNVYSGNADITEISNPNKWYESTTIDMGTVVIKAGDTTTKTLTNPKVYGKLTVTKKDSSTNDPLPNVVFTIKMTTGKKSGYYIAKDTNGNITYTTKEEQARLRTNENGQIILNEIYAGTCEITEISNPNPWYESVETDMGEVTVAAGKEVTKNLTNTKAFGDLEITKKDKDTNDPIPSVKFAIKLTSGKKKDHYIGKDSKGNIIYSTTKKYLTTNSDGKITLNKVYAGNYTIEEISNPNYGYEVTQSSVGTGTIVAGALRTKTVTNEKIYGKLVINKTDKDTGEKLKNIKFTIQMTSGEKKGQYVYPDSNGNAVYTNTEREVATNSNGQISIDHMYKGTYYIIETYNGDYYGYEITPINIGSVQIKGGETTTKPITNEKVYGKLIMHKKDKDTGKSMANVGFTIQMTSGKHKGDYVAVKNGKAVYQSKPSTIKTDKNGKIEIDYMYKGTYEIIETVNPYFGYENLPKNMGEVTVVAGEENPKTIEHTNRRVYVKVSGYAWEDKTDGKGSTKDYEWKSGTNDKKLQNINVTLKKANGTVLDTAVTDKNGAYIFGNYDTDSSAVKIKIDDLKGAYIEFEYNGMSYQSIPINSSFTMSQGKITGTKNSASDTALRNNFNARYATISKGISQNTSGQKSHDIRYTYSNYKSKVVYGSSVKYGYNGQSYPISGVYDQYKITATTNKNSSKMLCTQYTADNIRKNGIEEIAGINLGLEERDMPDLNISEQDLEKIEIQLNNYTHTYKYGQVSANPSGFAGGDVSNIAVRFASKYFESSYTREIYTADVVYNSQAGNQGKLKMFMTYKIELTNEATNLSSTVKTIANYYDARYENIRITDENGKEIHYETDNSYNANGLKRINIDVNQRLGAQTSKTITIRYQLSNAAINSLLNGNTTLKSISEITSYSTYQNNTSTTPYAGIDVDSAPDTITPNNKNTYEDDTNWAPSLLLTLKEGRVIKGTVWEDAPIESLLKGTGYDKQRVGDGQYKTTENIVNNVKVDLMTIDGSGNVALAKLYKKNNTVVNATTVTNGKGEYSFTGVVPGNYIIRYTYGDNSVICDANGKVIKNVDTDNYKSTIYRGGNQSAVNAMTDYWYRGETSHEGAIRLSDAKDNEAYINDRITEEEINYATATESRGITEISADTRKFNIKLEYDINLDNMSEYGVDLKFVFDNIDFGIIERPRQSLEIRKEISNVEITLANGITIMNGDPRSQNIQSLKMLPNGNIHIEIDDEIIQGATLRITYEITVNNQNCEIDYNDKNYYIYGTVPSDKENKYKISTIVDMFDYLPEELVLESTDGNWESIEITDDMKGTLLAEDVFEIVKKLQNVIHLKNPVFEDMKPGSEERDTSMVVSRKISVASDSLTYENDIEVIKLKGRKTIDSIPGNYDPTTNTPDEPDDDNVELTITKPQGGNRQYTLYGAIGIGILVVIGVGIVIIKRKVLRK